MVKKWIILLMVAAPVILSAQMVDTARDIEFQFLPDSAEYTQVIHLKPVTILHMDFEDPKERLEFYRVKRYINKVYPYAMEALAMMEQMDQDLAEMEKKRKKKKKIRSEYGELKDDYKDFLKDFYVEEGRVLIKIIERETGQPFYEVIKKYKSGLTAAYWEQLASLNGYSLKEGYDPEKEKYMEIILTAIEEGQFISEN